MSNPFITKLVNQNRAIVTDRLLPDICMIYPELPPIVSISGPGVVDDAAIAPRLWRGSSSIPCRVDHSRAFRPASLPNQNTEVDEFNLHLPFDMVVKPTDRVHLTNPLTGAVTVHVIRKMKDVSEWDNTTECTITELGVNAAGW